MRKAKKHFKKFLIPHKQNQYHPHIFRNASYMVIFTLCIFLLGISVGNFVFLRDTVLGANIATNVLIDMANVARKENNAGQLTRNDKLDYAAGNKASDMIENKYFAHNSPDGTTPWYFIHDAGYNFVYAGENLAINFFESNDVQNAWMNSQTHRANLLNTKFKEIGIATREGPYNGANSIYVVQMFGTEAAAASKIESDIPAVESASSTPEVTPEVPVIDQRVANIFQQQKEETEKEDIHVIAESKDFISAVDLDNKESDQPSVAGAEIYASFLDRLIFNGSRYIEIIYFVVLAIIFFAFLCRIFIEYERQHYRHIWYSFFFMLLIMLLAYLNHSFIISSLRY